MINDDNADDENDETLYHRISRKWHFYDCRYPSTLYLLASSISPPSNSTFRNLIQNAPLLSPRHHLRASSWKL